MSTLRERTAPLLGTVNKFKSPSCICSSSVFDDTFVKHESTDAARSRLRSGTVRKISRTNASLDFVAADLISFFSTSVSSSSLSAVSPLGCSESDAFETFSRDVPVGSTTIASCREMERRRCRGPGTSISSKSLDKISIVGDAGKTGGDEGNAGGEFGTTTPGRLGKAG